MTKAQRKLYKDFLVTRRPLAKAYRQDKKTTLKIWDWLKAMVKGEKP